jgi:Mn2+/Fe2+ NRAMP family transporter
MADRPPHSDTGDDTDVQPDRESTTSTPRWMKVIAISVIALVVLVVILLLTGGGLGGHGPGMHTP